MKKVVQDLTSGGKDCFPKYTKQFLNHYYGMNEFFRGESQMKKKDEIKVCLVGSSGGHLTHLYMLKPFWKDKNRFWVTFDKEDARSLLEGEKVYGDRAFQVIPNAFDTKTFVLNSDKRFSIRKKLGVDDNLVIGHIGKFNSQKNQEYLIRSVPKFVLMGSFK